MKKLYTTSILFLLVALLLVYPSESLTFASTGLLLWFHTMIPVLFPFMILSNLIINLNLINMLVCLFYPFIKIIFGVSIYGCYCIIMGFLCGFPMGAKVICDLYKKDFLSKEEADYLLSFCNNIGPIYFCSFVLPLFNQPIKFSYLFGMYGIPLLYGFFLKHIKYHKIIFCSSKIDMNSKKETSILSELDDSINNGIKSIVTLGGYMIFFNLLNIIPLLLFKGVAIITVIPNTLLHIINCIIEITSGLSQLNENQLFLALCLVSFGGLCCIGQTNCILKGTNLSIIHYIKHKIYIFILATLYYVVFYIF